MRLNRKYIGNYKSEFASAKPTGASLAEVDIKEWKTNLENIIPGGQGKILCNNSGICTISIKWTEVKGAGEGIEDSSTFSFSTRI
jgi:hypothetical protein